MKVTLFQLQNAAPVFRKIRDNRMDIKAAYWLKRGMDGVTSELKRLSELRSELFTKYGEPTKENPKEVRVKEEHMEVFVSEMDSLLSTEVEIDFKPLDLEKVPGLTLSVNEMENIEPFIIIPESWSVSEGGTDGTPKP